MTGCFEPQQRRALILVISMSHWPNFPSRFLTSDCEINTELVNKVTALQPLCQLCKAKSKVVKADLKGQFLSVPETSVDVAHY